MGGLTRVDAFGGTLESIRHGLYHVVIVDEDVVPRNS